MSFTCTPRSLRGAVSDDGRGIFRMTECDVTQSRIVA